MYPSNKAVTDITDSLKEDLSEANTSITHSLIKDGYYHFTPLFTDGLISSEGAEGNNPTWHKSDYIEVDDLTRDILYVGASKDDEGIAISRYISYYTSPSGSGFIRRTGLDGRIEIPNEAKYIRFTFGYSSATGKTNAPDRKYFDVVATKSYINDNFATIESIGFNKHYEYPYDGCVVKDNRWNDKGVVKQSDSWMLVEIPVKSGEKYYTNDRVQSNCVCYDSVGNVLSYGTEYENVEVKGRIYTIPDNAVKAQWNIQKSCTHGDISIVIDRLSKNKSILCIGDSITFLDGKSGYDDATRFLGWQKVLTENGYKVQSAGFSGYTYAVNAELETYKSLYTQIVTNAYDVSNYDYIILFGGTNDDLYDINIGSLPSSYDDELYDTTTTLGALSGIIDYVRTNNPTCKIILCSQIKSTARQRPYAEARAYRDGLEEASLFWDCYFNDLFRNFNVSPNYAGWNLYHYDSTHPNKEGMKRLGKLMLDAINNA